MFNKNLFLLVFVLGFTNLIAQTKNNEWQVGVGLGITKFSDVDALLIGDKYQFQIPRLNVTMPINDNFAVDGAVSVNTFDTGFIANNDIKYLSVDTSIRYFYDVADVFFPYVFTGVSVTESSFKLTPTFNVGAGATFWINDIFGLNTQVYYKYSLNSFESMRSHIQVTGGMVFALNLFDLFHNGSTSNGFCR